MTRHLSATRHGIPLLAAAMISLAGWSIATKHTSREAASPPIAAPTSPYEENVVGTGIVEPASEVFQATSGTAPVATQKTAPPGWVVGVGRRAGAEPQA